MKKLFAIMIAFSFLLAGCDKDMESLEIDNEIAILKKAGTNFSSPNTFDAEGKYCIVVNQDPVEPLEGKQMQLWMGVGNEKAGTLIGHVRFEPGMVIIDLTDADGDGFPDMYPYVIEDIHIHFAETEGGIPHTKKGNPIPGQFEYNITLDEFEALIEIEGVEFDNVGAIHIAVTKFGGIEGFAFYLPDDPVQVKFTYPGPNSYLQMEILSDNAGALKGTYDNWCVNTEIELDPVPEYEALLYSSYDEDIPAGIVDKPENWDLINYLINNYAEGDLVQPMDDCVTPTEGRGSEPITLGDIQKAIWELIDDETSIYLPETWTWSQERINAIVCEVEANGEDFEPGCDDLIVFLVVPIDPELGIQLIVGQPSISSVPVPCYDEGGTAWGDGYWGATFPGSKQWGTWFKYDADCGL